MKKKFIAKGVGAGLVSAREEKGITLIALVITIIVLLILAGVTIAMVVGDNGIFTRAREAKSETEIAEENEKRELTKAEAAMNMENTEYTDKNGDKAIIPAGFAVSQVEGENVIDDGLVVIDSSGNEFVWIPVKSKENYKKKLGSINTYGDEMLNNNSIDEIQKGDNLGITNILGTEIKSGIQNQPEADIVVNAGGFYVGRYESGVESNGIIDWESNPEVVVKRNVQPISRIGWQKMLQLANNWKIEQNVQSGLITGTQWDVMCDFIGFEITNQECNNWGNIPSVESSKYTGYYGTKQKWLFGKDIIKKVGESVVFPTGMFLTRDGNNTSQKNIYDIVGNIQEQTTEFYDDDRVIERGGDARSECWCCNET